jgi:hypothetical protein
MKTVRFRFYEELNRYLPEEKQKIWFEFSFPDVITIEEALELLGVPAPEIDLILVNQQSESLEYQLKEGDRISVYPVFELLDIAGISSVRETPLRRPAFICDAHLGRLCRYLRMFGLDSLYSNLYTADEIIEISLLEKRIILSRSLTLVRNERVTHAYWVRSSDPTEQLKDILENLNLSSSFRPLTRCLNCNSLLEPIEKTQVISRLQPNTARYFDEFFICNNCNHIFWKGTHYDNMLDFISRYTDTGK